MRRAVSTCHRIGERRCRLGLKEIRHAAFSLALAFSWLSLSALAQAQLAQADRIHVEISGLRSDKGQVLCALFSSAADFPKKTDKAVAQAKSDISMGMRSASLLASLPERMPCRFSMTRIPTASWIRTLWESPARARGPRTTQGDILDPRNSPPPLFRSQAAASI